MINVKTEGMEDISKLLSEMGEKAPGVAAAALYEGAGVMAKEIAYQAGQITASPFRYRFGGWTRKPSPEEKAAIQGAVGIAKFDKNGSEVNTSIGFGNAGYVTMPNGKKRAVAQIANAINSGTSFMEKQPFIRKAVSSARTRAFKAIADKAQAEFDALSKT